MHASITSANGFGGVHGGSVVLAGRRWQGKEEKDGVRRTSGHYEAGNRGMQRMERRRMGREGWTRRASV